MRLCMRSNHGLVNCAWLGRARPPATGHGQLRGGLGQRAIYIFSFRAASRSPFLSFLPPLRRPRVYWTTHLAIGRATEARPGCSVPRFKNKLTPASARTLAPSAGALRIREAGLSRARNVEERKANNHRPITIVIVAARCDHVDTLAPACRGPLPLARSFELTRARDSSRATT